MGLEWCLYPFKHLLNLGNIGARGKSYAYTPALGSNSQVAKTAVASGHSNIRWGCLLAGVRGVGVALFYDKRNKWEHNVKKKIKFQLPVAPHNNAKHQLIDGLMGVACVGGWELHPTGRFLPLGAGAHNIKGIFASNIDKISRFTRESCCCWSNHRTLLATTSGEILRMGSLEKLISPQTPLTNLSQSTHWKWKSETHADGHLGFRVAAGRKLSSIYSLGH